MKNDQQNSNDKTLLGLKKRTPSNKPKEERILETVNRVIHRIQNDERKCIWRNTTTRPVWDYPSFSRTRWPPFVTNITLMSPTWWDVRYPSSFRPSMRTHRIMGSWCSSDWKECSYSTEILRILRPKRPCFPLLQGLFRGYRTIWIKGQGNIHLRCFVSAV